MLYLVHLTHAGKTVRFQLAMLKSGWMKSYRGFMIWSLTSLDLKMRGYSEKLWVLSFYGTRTTSSFQARRQGQHRLRVVAGHLHLQEPTHPMTSTTTTRVHLDLRRRTWVGRLRRRLCPLRTIRGSGSAAQNDKSRPSQEYLIRIFLSELTTVLTRKSQRSQRPKKMRILQRRNPSPPRYTPRSKKRGHVIF